MRWPARAPPVNHQDVPVAQDHLGAGRPVKHQAAGTLGGVMVFVGDAEATPQQVGTSYIGVHLQKVRPNLLSQSAR